MAKINGNNRIINKTSRFTLTEKLLIINIIISIVICGLILCK